MPSSVDAQSPIHSATEMKQSNRICQGIAKRNVSAMSRSLLKEPVFRIAEMYCKWLLDGDRFSQQS
jgi:hypothetical protein